MTSKTKLTIALIDALAGKTSLYSQPSLVVPREAFELATRDKPEPPNRLDRYDCGLLFRLRQ